MEAVFSAYIYKFMLIFLRLGSALMIAPGFAASYINARLRLSIALAVSVVVTPFVGDAIPTAPMDNLIFVKTALFEVTYGIFLGLVMQFLFSALALVGNFAGQAIGFANAQMFDPSSQNQSIIVESFLSILALAIIFITDTHHLMLSAVVESYDIFPFGSPLPLDNFAEFLSITLNKSFVMGFKIGSPFIAFSIIFYTGIGLVSRLMPQLNIFFLSLPLQIYLGVGLLLITTPIMVLWFTRYYNEGLAQFVK